MKRSVLLCALVLTLVSPSKLEAAPVYTFAEVTAGSTANAGGSLWNTSQFREIMTPTAGESETASVTRNVTGLNGSGTGSAASQVSLGAQGFQGSLSQAMSLTVNSNFAFNFVAGSTSGGAFVDFTLSAPHNYTATASGQISGPTGADDEIIGVDIHLMRSNGALPVEFLLQEPGTVTLNKSGVLSVGTYSYQAAMLNTFSYDATPPGTFASSGNVSLSLTLTPVPESSSFVILVTGVASAKVIAAAARRRSRRRGPGRWSADSRRWR